LAVAATSKIFIVISASKLVVVDQFEKLEAASCKLRATRLMLAA
jgi:hypothetical protein